MKDKLEMKVLIVSQCLYPSTLGGQAKTIYWLGQALARKGVDVDIIASNKSIPSKSEVEYNKWIHYEEGLNIYYTDISLLHGLNKKIQYPVIRAINESRGRNYDILILCSIFYIPGFVAARLAKKIIWSPRGELYESAINGSRAKKIFINLIRLLYHKKTIYHATSTAEEGTIFKYFGKDVRTCIIPNLMYVPNKMEHHPESKYLLYVGRLSPIKALDNLVQGLSMSESFVNSEYKMVFVGAKEEKYDKFYQSLIKQIETLGLSDRIIFAGVKDGAEKFKLYSNAYFSFLVSHSENFGNVVIESLSQGTPVIASEGTPWESLRKERAGFWISNDPKMIAKTVDTIISMTNAEYLLYRTNARTLAEKFDITKNIGDWVDILKFNMLKK